MPWIKWFPDDWSRDTKMLTLVAKGGWIEILGALHSAEPRGQLSCSVEQWARIMGCTGEDAGRIIRELGKARVCDMVMESNDDVTIVCRRMKREGRNWELTRKRVARYRERHGSPMGPENETPPETQGLLLGNDDVTGEKPEARSQKLDIQPIAIYEAYPRHTARASALKAIHTALVTVSAERLLERTMAYAEAVSRWPAQDRTFIPYPATWFNRASYDDDPETWKRIQNANTRKGNSRGFEQSQSYEHVVNKL